MVLKTIAIYQVLTGHNLRVVLVFQDGQIRPLLKSGEISLTRAMKLIIIT